MTTSVVGPQKHFTLLANHPEAEPFNNGLLKEFNPSIMSASFADERSKIWNNLLSSQVSLFAEAEFRYLANLPEWEAVHSIADLGCGNGDYIARLADSFSEKSYIGFDTSEELISIAIKKYGNKNISFHCTDIADVVSAPMCDCVILRFVVQHLENPTSFFNSIRNIIRQNGLVVVIEPNLEASSAQPELKEFNCLMSAYEEISSKLGSTRAMLRNQYGIHQMVGNSWKVLKVGQIRSSHNRNEWNKELIARILYGWINVIEASQCLNWDYCNLKREVETWLDTSGRKIDIVLNATILNAAE